MFSLRLVLAPLLDGGAEATVVTNPLRLRGRKEEGEGRLDERTGQLLDGWSARMDGG